MELRESDPRFRAHQIAHRILLRTYGLVYGRWDKSRTATGWILRRLGHAKYCGTVQRRARVVGLVAIVLFFCIVLQFDTEFECIIVRTELGWEF